MGTISINLSPEEALQINCADVASRQDVSLTSLDIPNPGTENGNWFFGTHIKEAVEILKDWVREK